MRRTAALGILVLAFAAAGCGSDKKTPGKSPGTATSQTSAKATPDAAKAASAELQLVDFPPGWSQAPTAQKNPDPDCAAIKAAHKLASAREAAPDFSLGRGARTQSVIYAYPDATTAVKAFTGLSSAELRTCVGDLTRRLVSTAGGGVKAGAAGDTPLDIPAVGSARFAFRVAIAVRAKGKKAELDQDIVLVRSGRAISVVAMTQEVAAFDTALRNRLVRAAARRLEAAFGVD